MLAKLWNSLRCLFDGSSSESWRWWHHYYSISGNHNHFGASFGMSGQFDSLLDLYEAYFIWSWCHHALQIASQLRSYGWRTWKWKAWKQIYWWPKLVERSCTVTQLQPNTNRSTWTRKCCLCVSVISSFYICAGSICSMQIAAWSSWSYGEMSWKWRVSTLWNVSLI